MFKIKRYLFVCSIFFLINNLSGYCQKRASNKASLYAKNPRSILNFNTNWAFFRGDIKGAEAVNYQDKDWTSVSIPHTMRLEKKHNGGNAVYQGIGWYRRYFKIDKSNQGKRISLNFEGVQMNCEVFLNGEKLTTHHGGYIGFVVDITDKVKYDQNNILAVRVSSENDSLTPPGKPQSGLDFYYYGGIYRNVTLTISNRLYISDALEANKIAGGGLFITYPKVSNDKAEISIKTHIVNQTKSNNEIVLKTIIRNKDGIEVAKISSKETISGDKDFLQNLIVLKPKLWHPDHPYLYQVVSQIYEGKKLSDVKVTEIGIRNISFKSPTGEADGFYINGEKLYLRGANRHQCYQNIGDAASNSMQFRDALQIKNGGFNAVRAAHYPQSPAFLDACDKIGLLVIECEPSWQFFNKDSVFIARTHQNVREMIRRDRNRPSVFLWETSLNESPTPDYWAKEIVQIAHQEMPNDQMFTSDDFFAKGRKFYDVSYKVINEDGTDPMPVMPSLTREWGDTWMADPEKENGLRASRIYTEKGLLAQCFLRQNALNGSMLEEEGAYWDHARLDANKRIGGYFLWSYNDYTRGTDIITAFSGVVDLDRYEKFGYYQLKAMQDTRNPFYGPMVYVASYNNRPDLDSTITVFSNCDQVRLYRNNLFAGEMTRAENAKTAAFVASKGGSPYYNFKTNMYQAGELRAEGIIDGKVVCSHVVKTPGTADHLEIEIADRGIKPVADGSDMVAFYVKVCDKNGTVLSNKTPLETYKINLEVSGNGKLIGANIPRINIASQQTEGGIGYGIIQTTNQAGNVIITASGSGLKSAKAVIKTIPYNGEYVLDGEHVKWEEEKEINEKQFVFNKAESEVLPPVIKLSSDKVILYDKIENKGLDKIFDSNPSTLWTSSKKDLPIVMNIDLGKKMILQGSKIVWGKDSDWYTYSLEISENGTEWINAIKEKKVSGQDYKPLLYNYKNIRYLRISISEVQPENSKAAIKDIEFYGISM
ncbi:glycoside hydrolase family 2 TIM barrel-domain containing protein [Flavobacterium collinsii]|uniref:glycoside hydrolase family 2 protein n=1 Tax=Flavobacterium collinsii TaxID=1114861 RepID=UPI003757A68D